MMQRCYYHNERAVPKCFPSFGPPDRQATLETPQARVRAAVLLCVENRACNPQGDGQTRLGAPVHDLA
jgi:hypothetical protein